MLARFSPVLETARLYVKESQHVAILNTLYSANTLTIKDYETIEEVAVAYTEIAAEATMAGAGLWLYSEQDGVVHFVTHAGSGPRLISQKSAMPLQEKDWASWFYQGDNKQAWNDSSTEVPSCLEQAPSFPFAWIPLYRGKQPLGLLILTYTRPHLFSQEEKRVLEMFARQCAVALENAGITIELRAAYERQKELDILKDQFIITASHELRTPLTAVLGYIELLAAYNSSLSLETRADFIAKAHHGCDELALMVNNIMDASRVQLDTENVQLGRVVLAEPIQHVLEILEAMTQREQRTIQVDVPDKVSVMADTMRLRQVLLNLMSNALKYSPSGSSIEITSVIDNGHVTIRVQDHGLGVPIEDQVHLFERFVRLERDMNSPVRGAGLGLYICKQLVTAMGGEIWVESSGIPGEGSCFVFMLQRGMASSDTNMHALEHQEV
jgi:signal transduction histidine kinase